MMAAFESSSLAAKRFEYTRDGPKRQREGGAKVGNTKQTNVKTRDMPLVSVTGRGPLSRCFKGLVSWPCHMANG